MKSTARFGSFDDLLNQLPAAAAPAMAPIAHALRDVILAGLPDAVEVVRLGDNAASYGVGPKKMSESHVYIMPKTEYVNLGFYHASELPDPEQLLEGTGRNMRHVKVTSVEMAHSPAVQALVAAALDERRAALKLT